MSVKIAIVGAGSRGQIYASFVAQHPHRARIVAVAEPRREYREKIAKAHQIPAEHCFESWEALAQRPGLADWVVIATQDRLHTAPAIAFAQLGCHILLEKPMAPTLDECERIVAAAKAGGKLFAVAHVLRYTPYTRRLKQILDAGVIGEIVSIQHLEPVGYWHQAHSFVRGNWRNSTESTFMLMAKSCHDLDWLSHLADSKATAVSSFGGLRHFRAENRPPGAADRCLDCGIEGSCPYSAKKIYLGRVAEGKTDWPVDVLTPAPTMESVTEALRHGPYGRCVYACDNDVVDHQVVNLAFANGITVGFTMTAFTQAAPRITRIFGTRGEIRGDGRWLEIFDFLTDQTHREDTEIPGQHHGHGGGDFGLMEAMLQAIETGDPSKILTGPDATLESHRIVFAAEAARNRRCIVDPADL